MQRYNWYCRIFVGQEHKKTKKTAENQLFKNKFAGLNSSMLNCQLIFSFHFCHPIVEKALF